MVKPDSNRVIRVVGTAASGRAVVELVRALRPDVALLDIDMSGLGGLAAAAEFRRMLAACRAIMMDMSGDLERVRQAVAAGANGYVRLDAGPDVLRRAIETVHQGKSFFTAAGPRGAGEDGLSPREREVLILIASGRSNKDISARLEIGLRTIETHRARLMSKLSLANTAGLTRYALSHSLISFE